MEPLPDDKEYRSGALDRSLKPRSFMTEEQGMFTDWLLANSELIPVTARGTEEISSGRNGAEAGTRGEMIFSLRK